MLGDSIKQAMNGKKISAKDLAEKVKISPTHLSYIINGKRKPSLKLLENIALALDATLNITLS